jgi:RNA polymerase sigma factor (sigma-70 family)
MAATDTTTSTTAGRELVLELASKHAPSILAVARRYSLCADDAYDACQRALEILLRRADSLDPEGAPAWLRTVVKHEALAIRAARRRIVGPAEIDLDATEARELVPAYERAAAGERMDRSAEALSRLKPQEIRALVLKAQGYSYREIAEITNWTYTKVLRQVVPIAGFCLHAKRKSGWPRFSCSSDSGVSRATQRTPAFRARQHPRRRRPGARGSAKAGACANSAGAALEASKRDVDQAPDVWNSPAG